MVIAEQFHCNHVSERHDADLGTFTVHSINEDEEVDTAPYRATFSIDDKYVDMEIDTGTGRTNIPVTL